MNLPDKKRLKLLASLARGKVLDAGACDLPNPFLLNAVGFDIRVPRPPHEGYARFVVGDCQFLDRYFSPGSFDTIIAGEIIEHLENPSAFLRASRHVLKDDGQLLITTPNPYHWTTVVGNLLFSRRGIAPDHINLFPFRTMLSLLRHTGWTLRAVLNASAGMRLWHTTRCYFIPCPKAISWQLLYICEKAPRPPT
ncbi:MAG: class I SAM-dependent methyltransferase [Anaerolineae bacterium]